MENTVSNPFNLMMLMVLMGTLPFIITLTTSYIKIIVVTFLVRNALGVQQVPPSTVLGSLAIILSLFVMAPVGSQTYDLIQEKNIQFEKITASEMISVAQEVSDPLKTFLKKNTTEQITTSFVNTAKRIWPDDLKDSANADSFVIIVPAFVISELTKAFQIGFLLYLPFIAIDLIISNILLAMGMMMVSPMTISLPFKLMLFVALDGWLKLSQGLLYSYNYT